MGAVLGNNYHTIRWNTTTYNDATVQKVAALEEKKTEIEKAAQTEREKWKTVETDDKRHTLQYVSVTQGDAAAQDSSTVMAVVQLTDVTTTPQRVTHGFLVRHGWDTYFLYVPQKQTDGLDIRDIRERTPEQQEREVALLKRALTAILGPLYCIINYVDHPRARVPTQYGTVVNWKPGVHSSNWLSTDETLPHSVEGYVVKYRQSQKGTAVLRLVDDRMRTTYALMVNANVVYVPVVQEDGSSVLDRPEEQQKREIAALKQAVARLAPAPRAGKQHTGLVRTREAEDMMPQRRPRLDNSGR